MPRSSAGFFAASAALCVQGFAGIAEANIALLQVFPGQISGPMSLRPTVLEVEGERLDFRCADAAEPRCTFRAAYAVRNPTAEPQSAVAAFYGLRSESIDVRVGGASAGRTLSSDETAALDAAVHRVEGGPTIGRVHAPEGEVTRAGFALTVGAGARTEVVVTGVLRLKPRSIPGSYLVPAVWARHLWMHRTRPHREFDLDYLLGPLRTWARVGPIDVTVDVPSSWSLEGATMAADARRDESSGRRPLGFVLETIDGRTRARGRTSVDAGAVLTVRMTHPASGLHHGGPFLGIGGAPGADGGFRTRLGYEVAAPSFLLYSLTADTDWNTRIVVTPMVELASPWMLIVPSFGLGVGLPVRVTPDVLVGARIQGSMHLGPLGFVTTVDLYPTLLRAGAPGGSQVSLYASWSM